MVVNEGKNFVKLVGDKPIKITIEFILDIYLWVFIGEYVLVGMICEAGRC